MFLFSLVTPEKKVITDQEVEELLVPGFRGQLNILPGHAPLMTTLSVGILTYREKGSSTFREVAISWGYCEVTPKGVIVLAETAETKDEIDRDRAQEALKKAEKALMDPDLEPDQMKKFQRKMERARSRLELAAH